MRSLIVGSYTLIAAVLVGFALRGQPGMSPEVSRTVSAFDSARAMDDVRNIDDLTIANGGRNSGTPGNALVRDYVGRELSRAGLTVHVAPFGDMIGGRMTNIIGSLPGERDETILFCAHHDAGGSGPAAVGGTAGLAVLLELARVTSAAARSTHPPGRARFRTVEFASWDGDAFGCAGSSHFIDALPEGERRKLRAVVSMDAVGWERGADVLHVMPHKDRMGVGSAPPDWLVTRVSNAARERNGALPVGDPWLGLVYQVVVRAVDIGDYSDDRPFLAKGVPAVFVSNSSLTHPYGRAGTDADRIGQIGAAQIASLGRSMEAALTDLSTADDLPPGEQDYLVLNPRIAKSFRLTRDQVQVLAMICLLPGGIVLIRRRRDGGLVVTRTLFFAFATIYVIGTLEDPILFAPLFIPALLAGPLLAVPRLRALWGNLAAMLPALLFGALIIPVYVTGSASLIRLSHLQLACLAGLLTIGFLQAGLHYRRARRNRPGRSPIRFSAVPSV